MVDSSLAGYQAGFPKVARCFGLNRNRLTGIQRTWVQAPWFGVLAFVEIATDVEVAKGFAR
jgi:hypothetical protein